MLPPLVILQILAKNPRLKLSLVKDYMARQLKAENASIEEDQRQISKYEQETKAMREEVQELRTKVQLQRSTIRPKELFLEWTQSRTSGCRGKLIFLLRFSIVYSISTLQCCYALSLCAAITISIKVIPGASSSEFGLTQNLIFKAPGSCCG